ncbi:acyl-homoserine-lactone synthase [Roseisalinus antarcticus]|uniref:Acyl-homoserine-lactone synthase n=1 Tax=Roseisalinus antarcticus TaxID=254357 RepID=A0A1Y5RVB3_9RHOB|nr:acyl-homoserine-lactone synthase [Roseisalinus antarcticus]SLN23578.1 Acyl-homoserine-lactone synthase [Roseisalinus antarcticus]
MLRYIYADQLDQFPRLKESMFRDRADQFSTRLGWEVSVNEDGHERDDYDDMNPLYVIWETPEGLHGGSMRFLPTTGRTMVNDHFVHLTDGVEIRSPFIWECTRFCLSRNAESRVAGALMVACGEVMRGFSLAHMVGVFDARMVRIYRMIGASPDVLGTLGKGRGAISVGLWAYEQAEPEKVFSRAGIAPELSEMWFERSLGFPIRQAARAA